MKMSVEETQEENLSEMSQRSTSDEGGRQEDQPTLIHLWPYLEEFFRNGWMQKQLISNALQALRTQVPRANGFQKLAV